MAKVHQRAKRLAWQKKEAILMKEFKKAQSVKGKKAGEGKLVEMRYNSNVKRQMLNQTYDATMQ